MPAQHPTPTIPETWEQLDAWDIIIQIQHQCVNALCVSTPHIALFVGKMVNSRQLCHKLTQEIVSLHKKGNGYKKILNVPKGTVGIIIWKYKAPGTVAAQQGWQ